ncbi:MAG: NAD-dependent epimerase/dehydratase family protein [Phycisphaerales bacterium]
MPRIDETSESVLVLGATGSLGSAVSLELLSRGTHVRLLARDLERARRRFGNRANASFVIGDAMDDAVLRPATAAVRAVVVTLGLAAPAVGTAVSRVATALSETPPESDRPARRTIVVPVPPGADHGAVLDEISAVAKRTHLRLVVLTAGPLFGPTVRGGEIDRLCKAALAWKTIRTNRDLDARHAWVFAPDAAKSVADAIESSDQPEQPELIVCEPGPHTYREFLGELGRGAIRLTIPPGVGLESLNGRADPRIGRISGLSALRERLTRRRPPRRERPEMHEASPPPAGFRVSRVPPRCELAEALRTTLTSYRHQLA